MNLLPLAAINPTFAFAFGVCVALIIFLVLEIYASVRDAKGRGPIYEKSIRAAEEMAARIVEEARVAARKLMADAESASIALAGARKGEEEAAQKTYENSLKELLEKLELTIAASVKTAEESGQRISAEAAQALAHTGEEGRAHLAELFAALDNKYKEALDVQITTLVDDAKKRLAAYEKTRKENTEREIVSLVGETMRIVLGKSLPADVNAALVQNALEEAKQKGVL